MTKSLDTPEPYDRVIRPLVLAVICLLFLAAPAPGLAATCNDATGQPLASGDSATDLDVTGPCEVKPGQYTFHNVRIYSAGGTKGALTFDDASPGTDFFAESIVIENHGSLIAGSAASPIGTNSGTVTIHLWGPASDPGVKCKTDERCGVPVTVWDTNPAPSMTSPVLNPPSCILTAELPGGVTNACFYAYSALDPADMGKPAYFGHKVLALSYGGTLQLFGKKGATYAGREISQCKETSSSCSGTSWLRLTTSLKPGDTTLTVNGAVEKDWEQFDHIVVTTTDYLPAHSEELIISAPPTASGNDTSISFTNADGVTTGVKYPHNGNTYDLSCVASRVGLETKTAETRAAVALLTRSIRIVSEGDTATANSFPPAPTDGSVGYYYGGHTIVRQGFKSYQVQGVEFYQLGQGGAMMHYPVHFHMDRRTPQPANASDPPVTFVKDSSIHDSMTRWITIHATQGVTLARNVGYMSIGHGYYLEDGTETRNRLYSNIGILARAAVNDTQNPRLVPGILTAKTPASPVGNPDAIGVDNFPYYSDSNNPAVFWITNGWNDFEYNAAFGAQTCGACYWFVPAAISGLSQTEKWYGYAGEQQGVGRAGISPLQEFLGNSCTSAMNAFTVNSTTQACNGVNQKDPSTVKPNTILSMLPSPGAEKAYKAVGKDLVIDPLYWPITNGGGRLATRCKEAEKPGAGQVDCSAVRVCSNGDEKNCDVTVLDQFETAFNWASQNFAAVWMRPFWSLVVNSIVSDVQNGGINFVTSGDYSKSAVINGFWALARKVVYIGNTQSDNPYASNAGAFNPQTSSDGKVQGLACAVDPVSGGNNPLYCLSKDQGVAIQLSNFSGFQRFFSVYDGPAYQDSNACLDVLPTYMTSDGTVTGSALCKPSGTAGNPCANSGYMNAGLAGLKADQKNMLCYLPNACIGWKQPNGFYYAPAFHSTNMFFSNVAIRHFVTEPLFLPGTFDTDVNALKSEYCYWGAESQPGTFTGFTDIDRETVLNDDDGSLTGLTSQVNNPPTLKSETISVNKESFFNAPTCSPECASDLALNATGDAKLAPNTANTSPYEYVTTALFPRCALDVPLPPPNTVVPPLRLCEDKKWGSACTTSDPAQSDNCLGVPLYRQYLLDNEQAGTAQLKRMMGQNTFQRSGLTVNHGSYYIDTTISKGNQTAKSPNAFTAGGKYDLFFLYANMNTQQTYTLWVGTTPSGEKPIFDDTKDLSFGYVDITTAQYTFKPANDGKLPAGWSAVYTPSTGILTVTTNMQSLASDFDLTKPKSDPLGKSLCQPSSMCAWQTSTNQCSCNITDPNNYLYSVCHEKNAAGQDAICSWSVKDLDCPAAGCPAVEITFPSKFAPDNAADHHRPTPVSYSFDKNFMTDWNVEFNFESSDTAGTQCLYSSSVACQ